MNLFGLSTCAVVLSFFALFSLPACSAQTTTAPGSAEPGSSTGTAELKQQSQAAGAPVDSGNYQVGPTDVLNVNVWHEPDFSGPVTVHSDGKITLKLVGDLQAGGKTPLEIQATIKEALAKYVKDPLVTVTVQEVLSKKYYMDGEITRPGEYSLASPTTILEAISKAGGLRDFANEKKIYVLRGDKRISFNYKEVTHGKRMEQNIALQSGDHVFVP
jgi:polysaccharide biosynthesis/export protein